MAATLSANPSTVDLSPGGAPVRLGGLLSSGVTLAISARSFQRLYVAGLSSIRIVARCSAISSTAQGTDVRLYGMIPPTDFSVAENGVDGTRESAALGSMSIANDVDGILSVALNHRFVELEVVRSASSTAVLGPIIVAGGV